MDAEVAQSPHTSGTHLLEAPPAGEKRRMSSAEAEDSSLVTPLCKKPRMGREEMRRVAEIVLVLSAMGRMRGGNDPTEAELALMAEAREKLAGICETLAPKDIVANDAIESVIEDLGLKSRDQRLGFKVSKLSIAEKLLFTKSKMEDANKYPSQAPAHNTAHSTQGSFNSGTENRGVQLRFQTDKVSQTAVTSGVIPPASPPGGNSGSITYHFGAPNESRTSAVPSAVISSQSSKDSSTFVVPKVERMHAVAEGASSVSSRASIVQAKSPINQPAVSAPNWSTPTKFTSLTNLDSEKNVANQIPGNVQEATNSRTSVASQAARDMVQRPYVTKTASLNSLVMQHQPSQSVTAVPPAIYGNHNEISNMVQKWLSQKRPEHPAWTPPSREYMNKTLTCQICQMTVNDVESVLLCDACEKGYHLKCMQSQNQIGIPKVEWHCQKCLALSHGKPLPPKYGRVMRSMATSKMTATAFGVHSSSEKKLGSVDLTLKQQKVTADETSELQNTGSVVTADNNQVGLQLPESRETQVNNPAPMNEEKHIKLCLVDAPANVSKTVGSSCSSADVLSSEVTTPNMSRPESPTNEKRQASTLSSDLPENQNSSDNNQSQLPDHRPDSPISEIRQVSELSSELPGNGSKHFSSLQNPSDGIQLYLPDFKAESSISEAREASNLSSELPENDCQHFLSLLSPSDNIQSQLPDCRAESSICETSQASNCSELPANESGYFPSLQNPSDKIQSQMPDCRDESSIPETMQASNLMSELPENESEHFSPLQNPSDNIQTQMPSYRPGSSISETRQVSNLISELPEHEYEYFSSLRDPSDNIQPQLPEYRTESSISETQAPNISSEIPENGSEHFSSLQNPSDSNQSQLLECAEVPVEPSENSHSANKDSEKSPAKDHTDCSATKVEDVEILRQDPLVSAESTGTTVNDGLPPEALHVIDWVGNVIEIVDGKAFYSSCCIDGVTYKLKEHALFRSSHGKLEPSLLMAMWEDKSTGLTWVNVSRCYFPGDLPENVGHPFTEANEVFESNHEDTFVAGWISGPCEVLPPIKYKEETERRSYLGADAIAGLRPIFLCKWFYDEAKGHFQPISS